MAASCQSPRPIMSEVNPVHSKGSKVIMRKQAIEIIESAWNYFTRDQHQVSKTVPGMSAVSRQHIFRFVEISIIMISWVLKFATPCIFGSDFSNKDIS